MRSVLVIIAASLFASGARAEKAKQPPSVPANLLYRVDHVAHGGACEGEASAVSVGFDANGNGVLDDSERHGEPMILCGTQKLTTKLEGTPPNAYCPRPGAHVVLVREHQATHAELEVCLNAAGTIIEGTYAVYSVK
ncbi:MAG: hypothetical protein JST54_06200 [Deltaproteobacteria bacterium]|nr:hypothetical protein [Deltaproteobacteria bacterium]